MLHKMYRIMHKQLGHAWYRHTEVCIPGLYDAWYSLVFLYLCLFMVFMIERNHEILTQKDSNTRTSGFSVVWL